MLNININTIPLAFSFMLVMTNELWLLNAKFSFSSGT